MINKLIKSIAVILNFSPKFFLILDYLKKFQFRYFLKHKIKPNTILITDPINEHGEVMPGIIKYCIDLGYSVEILITKHKAKEKPFKMFKNIKVFSFGLKQYFEIIKSDKLNEYKKVIFTSSRVYYNHKNPQGQFVFDYVGNNVINKDKIILVEHHLESLIKEEKEQYKFIALPQFSNNYEVPTVNPHYFGDYKTTKKHKNSNFVVIGEISPKRKNHTLLIETIRDLLNKNITNFNIIVIGNGKLEISDKKIKNKIKFMGRLSYEKMYNIISKSDYILSLLDSNNILHDRYIKYGTSGTFQLSYGFLKPLIIDEKFSIPHGLNSKNSIIYKDNNLSDAMERAIKESNKNYLFRISKLKEFQDKIYKSSISNLKNLIG